MAFGATTFDPATEYRAIDSEIDPQSRLEIVNTTNPSGRLVNVSNAVEHAAYAALF